LLIITQNIILSTNYNNINKKYKNITTKKYYQKNKKNQQKRFLKKSMLADY